MARAANKKAKKTGTGKKLKKRSFKGWIGFLALRATTIFVGGVTCLVFLFKVMNPPITYTIWSEKQRLGAIDSEWVAIEDVAPVYLRSVVAAEDAQFCRHWGFDVVAIRAAIEAGGSRGGSTITQQVVKNVFLWQGRSWVRKALEAVITPAVEAVWSKRRILEVYVNVAEMDEGVFGVETGAETYFGVKPSELAARQSALLATVLPAPRSRSAAEPTKAMRKRAEGIMDGAATIRADGRSACFED